MSREGVGGGAEVHEEDLRGRHAGETSYFAQLIALENSQPGKHSRLFERVKQLRLRRVSQQPEPEERNDREKSRSCLDFTSTAGKRRWLASQASKKQRNRSGFRECRNDRLLLEGMHRKF